MDCESNNTKRIDENSDVNNLVNSVTGENSSSSVDQVVVERVIVINSPEAVVGGEEVVDLKPKVDESEKLSVVEKSIVVDVKCKAFCENLDGELVCRICHLDSEQPEDAPQDLIELGCGCKDELGVAHTHCAEAWFKLKGNRVCEICGETAKNVMGISDNRFMEEWNERRVGGSSSGNSRESGGCWRGQPFCNFLMACLVIAFVLPWFFRVNMF